jgi:hypothetical protein
MKCMDCKFFQPTRLDRSGQGECNLTLPPWVKEKDYRRSVMDGRYDECDLGQAQDDA